MMHYDCAFYPFSPYAAARHWGAQAFLLWQAAAATFSPMSGDGPRDKLHEGWPSLPVGSAENSVADVVELTSFPFSLVLM